MNDNDDFVTLTELSLLFVDASSHSVGKTLKVAKMRTPDGKPTPLAIKLGLTRKFEGPQPWIPLWKWHKVKILPYLEYHGLERIEETVGTTEADARQTAAQAREYLEKHGVCLSWHFPKDYPPSKDVKNFLSAKGKDIFDLDYALTVLMEDAIDNICSEWLQNDEDGTHQA